MENTQTELFRLAAVIYADNNYEVSVKTIHRKIIESTLLELNKNSSIYSIIEFAQDKYDITLSEQTVREITIKEDDKFHTNEQNDNIFVCLTEKRRLQLESKLKEKTIEYFVREFKLEYPEFKNTEDVIGKFLYELFCTNSESFQKLLDNKKEIKSLINLDTSSYSEKEKEIINNFLHWNNPDKDKAIFNIASYALEYCMLTNKNGNQNLQLKDLRGKKFYLDTNIIYRALGINGETRERRTKVFLKKFVDAGEEIIISKSTNKEFLEGIQSHIRKIEEYNTPRVNSRLFQSVGVQKDIYSFYHNWRIGKINTSLDLFLAEIMKLYDTLKKEFSIQIDTTVPYDIKNLKIKTLIDDYVSSISNFKLNEKFDYINTAQADSENILWIEKKRDGNDINIFNTKYFFISTDQSLRRWDFQRKNTTPIVLLPSQWMTILLRYFDCTSDDYKSFISFLNLKNNERLIDGEKLQVVLAGIGEMTETIEQQQSILNSLLETKFNKVIGKNFNSKQIFYNAKQFAKDTLEEQLKDHKNVIEELVQEKDYIKTKTDNLIKDNSLILEKYDELSNQFSTHKLVTEKILSQTQEDLQEAQKKAEFLELEKIKKESELEYKNLKLQQELQDKKKLLQSQYIKKELNRWRRTAKYCIPLVLLLVIIYIFHIFFHDWEYNYVYKLIEWVDNLESNLLQTVLATMDGAILLSLASLIGFIYFRLINKSTKKKFIEAVKEDNEYKSI